MRKLLFLTPAAVVLGLLGLFGACSSGALVAEGGACFQAIDCEPGLVCIQQKCTKDLTSIAIVPPEAGGPMDAANPDGTITYDGATDAPPPKDTGVPDSPPPPKDTGVPDVAPPVDSGGD